MIARGAKYVIFCNSWHLMWHSFSWHSWPFSSCCVILSLYQSKLFYVFCCLNSGRVHVALLFYMSVNISVIYTCGGKYILFSCYVAHLLNMRIFTKSHRLYEIEGLPLLSCRAYNPLRFQAWVTSTFQLTNTKMGIRNLIKDFWTPNMIFRLCLNVVRVNNIRIIKPTRCTDFSNLFLE